MFMEDLKTHISAFLSRWKGKHFYVACSGGLDSTVLLHLVHSMNVPLTALHVNYHLRGEDSNLDEEHLRNICRDRNIPIQVKEAEPNSIASNLQSKAREIRYSWFEEIIQNDPDGYIMFAHHREDQIETFMLNLLRQSGVMGLASMTAINGRYIRPLLNYSKDDLKVYAVENGIKWREDQSNSSIKYKRNLLRNLLIPQLNEVIPSLNESVLVLIDQFQGEQKRLEDRIKPLKINCVSSNEISLREWSELSELEKCELMRQLDIPIPLVNRLNDLAQSIKGKYLQAYTNKGIAFTLAREEDCFKWITEKVNESKVQFTIENDAHLPSQFDKNSIYLDTSKLDGELRVRPWVIGDRMAPIGMRGTKLISDIIAEAKIPFADKENVLVLCDNSHIHWCVGLKVGRLAIADDNSNSIISYSISSPESQV